VALRILLLTPRRRFLANRFGLGYQIPLGMVLLGGPLVDAGHVVRLIDNDLYGWDTRRLIAEIARLRPDCALLGHTGSTAAHPACVATARALKVAFPRLRIAYGGVYPSYAAEAILRDCPALDVIVRGEGEAAVITLAKAWDRGRSLAEVEGITWRDGAAIRTNPPRPPIHDLDAFRPGWELVDWPGYSLFGLGRSAGAQFSRGCPLRCTYCGQWGFWRRYRHRSPADFVAQLRTLAERYGVRIVWLADENFAADRAATVEVLQRLVAADLGLSLNVNMTAADVVRDAELLPLYKAAGVDYVVMGIEALDDAVVASVRKNNPFAVSTEAVRALRRNRIVSLVNLIYGLEDETVATLAAKLRRLFTLDPDILNAVYLTPHHWTAAGRAVDPRDVIQPDLARWTYRNQVLATPRLTPWLLFGGVKLTEALFHLRPRALLRLVRGGDRRVRRILRASLAVGMRVVAAEVAEFLVATRFVARGTSSRLPGLSEETAIPAGPRVESDVGLGPLARHESRREQEVRL
jgi:anaerobic magnesium-protoporphyrin IX monomethyl ester cyclase